MIYIKQELIFIKNIKQIHQKKIYILKEQKMGVIKNSLIEFLSK